MRREKILKKLHAKLGKSFKKIKEDNLDNIDLIDKIDVVAVNSDSDASENRAEEREIALENVVIERIN